MSKKGWGKTEEKKMEQIEKERKNKSTLIVIGLSAIPEAVCTMFFILVGLVRRADPAPLLTTRSIGQPIFISMKSTVHSFSISSTVRATVSGYAPHICTPKRSSDECRLNSAHSDA